jgi:NADH-quinone oxidoreductase subunit J
VEALVAQGPALLFFLFAAVAVGGAVLVVVLRNPMHGAIALLASFLSVAALFLLRHAEFLAAVQVFVYGGGIMVLFLFVIMLVHPDRLRTSRRFTAGAPLALVLVMALAAVIIVAFLGLDTGPSAAPTAFVEVDGEVLGNSEAVAWLLYREYLLPFEVVSVFLLVAMIGAVLLGRKA